MDIVYMLKPWHTYFASFSLKTFLILILKIVDQLKERIRF